MIDVRVREHYRVDTLGLEEKMTIAVVGSVPSSLIEPAIEENAGSVDVNEML